MHRTNALRDCPEKPTREKLFFSTLPQPVCESAVRMLTATSHESSSRIYAESFRPFTLHRFSHFPTDSRTFLQILALSYRFSHFLAGPFCIDYFHTFSLILPSSGPLHSLADHCRLSQSHWAHYTPSQIVACSFSQPGENLENLRGALASCAVSSSFDQSWVL